MVSSRPLLYLSLPGVAFILGVFWFRRRNKNRLDKPDDEDTSAIKDSAIEPTLQARKANGVLQNGKLPQQPASKSMNINGTIANGSGSGGSNSGSGSDEKDSPTMLYGKSAPIKIQSNGRTSNGKHQQQIDSEMLKSKIQDAEHKKLCSIDEDFENLSSPRDLPDSVNTRVSFYNRKASQKTVEPVVIKATRTPKISPENSFLDTNYTTKEECEQNNNCEPKEKGKKEDVAKEETSKKPYSSKVRICTIEGTESEIDAALAMIRQRLPAKRYPNFTMQRIHFALPQTIVPLSTESLYNLQVSDGVTMTMTMVTMPPTRHGYSRLAS